MASEPCLPAPGSPPSVGVAHHHHAIHHVIGRIRHHTHPAGLHAVPHHSVAAVCGKGGFIAGQPGGLPALPAGWGAKIAAIGKPAVLAKLAATGAVAMLATAGVYGALTGSLPPLSPGGKPTITHPSTKPGPTPPTPTPIPAPRPTPTPIPAPPSPGPRPLHPSGGTTPVPEPGSAAEMPLALLSVLSARWLLRRRKRC